jgi:predicted Holliday junction resolvase-like endonuclease
MNEFVDTVTYAAGQSDRWMFVALLAIGVVFSTVLFRHFANQTASIRKEMREQNHDFIAYLKLANREITELVKTAHEIIGRNTSMMERVERKLDGDR